MSRRLPPFYPALAAKIQGRLKPDERGCQVWPRGGARHARVRFRGKLYAPHRVMLECKLERLLGQGEFACHHCDNPPCANPDHLFAGTARDNVLDAVAKGRQQAWTKSPAGLAAIAESNRRRRQPTCEGCRRFLGPDRRCDACEKFDALSTIFVENG